MQRIGNEGPAGFYEGPTAEAFEREMQAHGGLITREDLRRYTAVRRAPVQGTYRGYEVLAMPPPTSGGVAFLEMLNILEGYELAGMGPGSSSAVHLMIESMRRAFRLGPRTLELRKSIRPERASKSSPSTFEWPMESNETTHVSAVDSDRNAVSMTYTLEQAYGAKIVLPGGGFLLN